MTILNHSMRVFIIEFWDCHYELIDSYLTSLAGHLTTYDVTIFALNPSLCAGQTLLAERHKNIKMTVAQLAKLDSVKINPDLCIVNTSHIHGNPQSLQYSLKTVEALKAKQTLVVCHNSSDVDYFRQLRLVNKKCLFLAEDCISYYFSKGLLKPHQAAVYPAFADYKHLISDRARFTRSRPLNLAITGMIREGKKLSELSRFRRLITQDKIRIHVYGSAPRSILKSSGYYNVLKEGYIHTAIVTHTRIDQNLFLRRVSQCDALLDLKIKHSEQSRGSTSGNLQLSRSLAIPLITHVSSHPNFPTINFLDYEHLEFLFGSPEISSNLIQQAKQQLDAVQRAALPL